VNLALSGRAARQGVCFDCSRAPVVVLRALIGRQGKIAEELSVEATPRRRARPGWLVSEERAERRYYLLETAPPGEKEDCREAMPGKSNISTEAPLSQSLKLRQLDLQV